VANHLDRDETGLPEAVRPTSGEADDLQRPGKGATVVDLAVEPAVVGPEATKGTGAPLRQPKIGAEQALRRQLREAEGATTVLRRRQRRLPRQMATKGAIHLRRLVIVAVLLQPRLASVIVHRKCIRDVRHSLLRADGRRALPRNQAASLRRRGATLAGAIATRQLPTKGRLRHRKPKEEPKVTEGNRGLVAVIVLQQQQ
jgi:hypothetical protein